MILQFAAVVVWDCTHIKQGNKFSTSKKYTLARSVLIYSQLNYTVQLRRHRVGVYFLATDGLSDRLTYCIVVWFVD
jgi:hypothetical protein